MQTAPPPTSPPPAAPTQPPDAPPAWQPSPWSTRDKVRRVAWMFVQATLFRCSFHNWYTWRRLLLRAFGAKVGRGVRVRPTVCVEIPWNVDLGDDCIVGDFATLYSLGTLRIGRGVLVSQHAYLCAGSHDHTDPTFPLLTPPVVIEDGAWVAAGAFIGPGVTVGARSVVGARSAVFKDVPPDQVWGGNPAKYLKPREILR